MQSDVTPVDCKDSRGLERSGSEVGGPDDKADDDSILFGNDGMAETSEVAKKI